MYLPHKLSSLGLIGAAIAAALTATPLQAQSADPDLIDEVLEVLAAEHRPVVRQVAQRP